MPSHTPILARALQRYERHALRGTGVFDIGTIGTITDDAYYNAWPIGIKLANGNVLVAYTKAFSHHNDNSGNAVCRTSTDEGTTFAAEVEIYAELSTPKWSSIMGLVQISTGRIIATLWRDIYNSAGSAEAGIVYSDDNGATWSSWKAIPAGFTQEAYGAGPAIELADGTLFLTVEGSDTGQAIANRSSRLSTSTDHGATWSAGATVRNYVTDTRPYYESKLLKVGAALTLCIHRTSGGTGTHYISASYDHCATWQAPVSAFTGYGAPSAVQLWTGTIVVATRDNATAGIVIRASRDNGGSWLAQQLVDNTMYESEYGCPIPISDAASGRPRVLLVYGYQPSSAITNSDIKKVILTEQAA